MQRKNKMEFGEVHGRIQLSLEYDIYERRQSMQTKEEVRKTVSFDWGPFSGGNGMSISALVDFQEKANELLELVKSLLEKGTYVRFTLTKEAYERVPEYEFTDQLGVHTSSIYQVGFECWTFEGSYLAEDPKEEGAGLYLQPDTKYTDATWDMVLYWNQDILKSLAEAHL